MYMVYNDTQYYPSATFFNKLKDARDEFEDDKKHGYPVTLAKVIEKVEQTEDSRK